MGNPKIEKIFRRCAPKKKENSARVLQSKELLRVSRNRADNAEPDVVATVVRMVVEAIGRWADPRDVVTRATAQQPI